MNVKKVVVGELQENCYILEDNGKSIIIDPGDEADKIINNIKFPVVGILITHYHFDHIGALEKIKEKYNLEENKFDIEGFNFEVLNTPGHTSDSKTFYFKDYNMMFVGDFIFKNSIGRMDLPTGNPTDMKKSIDNITKYPSDIVIYPGHGELTTLKDEIDNLYLYFD